MNMFETFRLANFGKNCRLMLTRRLSYVQGQEPEPRVREYFYYIDHQGMLFLDDSKMKNFTSCIKEKKFLRFFFNQLKINNTKRCDDRPFVFTHITEKETSEGQHEMHLAYNHADSLLTLKFLPDKVVMIPETGRVYHPAPERVGSVGLVQSKLAIELSKFFHFDNGETNPPTQFTFMGETYKLDNEWYLKKHHSSL